MKISEFLYENFHFLVMEFSVYLNRLVYIMILGKLMVKFVFTYTKSTP